MRRRLPLLLALSATALGAQPPHAVALVANQQSASASLIDVAAGTSREIAVGTGPHEAAILPGGRRGVVTVYGDRQVVGHELAVIDLVRGTVERTIDLGRYTRPHGVVPVPGRPDVVAVTSEATQSLLLVDVVRGTVDRVIPTNARASHMAALPTRGAAAGVTAFTANIADGSTSQLDLVAGALTRVLPVSAVTEGIAVTPDGREVWLGSNTLGTVSVVDVARGAVVATIPDLGMPYRLGITPDGERAVAVDPQGDRITVIDVASRTVVGTIGGLGSPRGVAIAPDSRTAFITSAGASSAILVDLVLMRELRRVEVGSAPDGVAYAVRDGGTPG